MALPKNKTFFSPVEWRTSASRFCLWDFSWKSAFVSLWSCFFCQWSKIYTVYVFVYCIFFLITNATGFQVLLKSAGCSSLFHISYICPVSLFSHCCSYLPLLSLGMKLEYHVLCSAFVSAILGQLSQHICLHFPSLLPTTDIQTSRQSCPFLEYCPKASGHNSDTICSFSRPLN